MPYGMGPAGWYMWPYFTQGMRYWYPSCGFPGYGIPFGFPYPPLSEEEEKRMLEQEKKSLEEQLACINERLSELKKTKPGGKK